MIYQVPTVKNSTKPALYKNAVALCVDLTYLPYASFVAHQILAKEPNRDFDIVICVPNDTELPKSTNQNIRYCSIDYSSVPNLPIGRLSMAAYYRLFLPAIFHNEYEQILYLDADVYIVNGNISETMQANKNDIPILMAVDISEIERKSGFDLHNSYLNQFKQINHLYRNSGVLLFNTKELMKIDYLAQLFDYSKNNQNKLIKHDQTLINIVLYKSIGSLSFLNNFQLIDSTIPLVQEFNPNILHFVGELKPWNTNQGFIGSFHGEYKNFVEQNFPNHHYQLKSEFQVKYECRQRKCKYKNPLREKISLKIFLAKGKIKLLMDCIKFKDKTHVSPKIRRVLPRFKSSIHHYILESEMQSARYKK